jgi:small subunit ribosomal protein S9
MTETEKKEEKIPAKEEKKTEEKKTETKKEYKKESTEEKQENKKVREEKNKETTKEKKTEEEPKENKTEETEEEETEIVSKKSKKKKTKRSKKYGMLVKSKKKEAIARAVIKIGKGRITVNKRNIEFIEPEYVKELIFEPVKLAGDAIKETDIKIIVKGGGFMSQAVAARSVIAKAIVEYTNDKKLKEKFIKYDRLLMVDDHRRVEPKKPLGTKARKKKQSSKR